MNHRALVQLSNQTNCLCHDVRNLERRLAEVIRVAQEKGEAPDRAVILELQTKLERAIEDYSNRSRRFGNVISEKK